MGFYLNDNKDPKSLTFRRGSEVSQGYVKQKVKQMEPWMTAAARTELCKAVAKDHGWPVSAAEFEGWKRCGKATGLGISILILLWSFCTRECFLRAGIRLSDGALKIVGYP